MQEQLKVYEDKMNKSLEVLLSDYSTIRAGMCESGVFQKSAFQNEILADAWPRHKACAKSVLY